MKFIFKDNQQAVSIEAVQGLSEITVRDCETIDIKPVHNNIQTVQIHSFAGHFEIWITYADKSHCVHSSEHFPDRHYNE